MPDNGVAFNLQVREQDPTIDDQIQRWTRDLNLFISNLEIAASDRFPPFLNRRNNLFQRFDPSPLRGLADLDYDAVSEPGSVALDTVDPFGLRENQVNFIMDLFQQRVERSRVMGEDLLSEAVNGFDFGDVEESDEMGMDNLDMDFGLGFGSESNDNFGFVGECCYDDDGFFVEWRSSRSESGETPSTVSGVETFANSVRVVGIGSDSEYEVDEGLGIDFHLENEYGFDQVDNDNDEDAIIPLCWDSLGLDDHRETNVDVEWEEMDGRIDEREILSSIAHSVSPTVTPEEEMSVERMANYGWEVLFDNDNLENLGLGQDGEHFIEPLFYTVGPRILSGQFLENENALMSRPPASEAVVQNLPTVILTEEDTANNNSLCAVCKDEIKVGEKAKQLPCAHSYHGNCILPWLGIQNTCPVCRYELPTDDAVYEQRKAPRASSGI